MEREFCVLNEIRGTQATQTEQRVEAHPREWGRNQAVTVRAAPDLAMAEVFLLEDTNPRPRFGGGDRLTEDRQAAHMPTAKIRAVAGFGGGARQTATAALIGRASPVSCGNGDRIRLWLPKHKRLGQGKTLIFSSLGGFPGAGKTAVFALGIAGAVHTQTLGSPGLAEFLPTEFDRVLTMRTAHREGLVRLRGPDVHRCDERSQPPMVPAFGRVFDHPERRPHHDTPPCQPLPAP